MLQRLKSGVKRSLATALYASGILGVLARRRLRGRAVVLMYHRVLAADAIDRAWSHPGIVVRAETFARQVALIRRHFTPLTLAAFAAHLRDGRPFPPRACLVTFDDGWLDTATVAWPILREAQVPAVVFLPSGYIGTGAMFWQERLRAALHAVWEAARTDPALADTARTLLGAHGFGGLLDVPAGGIRMAVMDGVLSRKYHELEAAATLTTELERLVAGRPRQPLADAFMTWPQVQALAAEGLTFGGHSRTHRLMTDIPPDEAAAEADDSRQAIAAALGVAPFSFAYPNGNWNPEVAAQVARSGYSVAFTTEFGHVAPGDPPLSIRRVNIHEDGTATPAMFMARILGVF